MRLSGAILTFCIAILTTRTARAQEDLFGPTEHKESRHGLILNGNIGMDLPGGDMAKRFGLSYRIGPALLYKTTSNWLFGSQFDFIVGRDIKQDSLMINIRDKYATVDRGVYEFINNDGERIGVQVYERGYAVGLSAGRIFSTNKNAPDNGFTILTTAGFVQHKINIFNADKSIMSLRGHYLKGYDRLANGWFIQQYAGYSFFSKSRLINFTLGVEAMVAFTQGRRDWLYDVMRPDHTKRTDMLFGVRAGWFIPMFKRKSEDMMFE